MPLFLWYHHPPFPTSSSLDPVASHLPPPSGMIHSPKAPPTNLPYPSPSPVKHWCCVVGADTGWYTMIQLLCHSPTSLACLRRYPGPNFTSSRIATRHVACHSPLPLNLTPQDLSRPSLSALKDDPIRSPNALACPSIKLAVNEALDPSSSRSRSIP
ncbi:hypothetical protein B0H10DRAFT_2436631 [Mycena sp. CBHHK59/15]|nr:hypothetical protein B0H10DRAFT_2436631 [Mycena sp. CBHHK59/15]